MTSGLLTGLHLTITNNGNQCRSMKHGTQHNHVNNNPRDNVGTRPHAPAEVPHILDNNLMLVVHHLPTLRPGTVLGVTGMGINTGMVHRGKASVRKTPCVDNDRFCSSTQFILVVTLHVIMTQQCRYDLL